MIPRRQSKIRMAWKNAAVLRIDIYDDIGPAWLGMVDTKEVAAQLKKFGDAAQEIEVHLNSSGGDVFHGEGIYNLLVAHPAKICVYVDGLAASIASVIAMAGDTIYMAENALLMIHLPYSVTVGNAAEHRAQADLLDLISEKIIGIYSARTGIARSRILDWMADETWFDANDAIEHGFADKLVANKAIAARFDPMREHFKNLPRTAFQRLELIDRLDVADDVPEMGMSLSEAKRILAAMQRS